ncbi:MAG TPA: ATP-dependent helicase, partial [Azospirillaceae bacterium]|nr:ATP-dependent helicase [Azospirillaceae bacterium]
MPLEDSARPAPPGVPYSHEDLARVFEAKTIQRGRTLILAGAVRLGEAKGRVEAMVSDLGRTLSVTVTPTSRGRRIGFDRVCTCGRNACAHMAAVALLALDTRPEWQQVSLLDLMSPAPSQSAKAPLAERPAKAPPTERPAATPPTERPAATPPAERSPAPPTAAPMPSPAPVHRVRWTLEGGRDDIALFVSAGLVLEGAEDGPALPATPRDVIAKAARDTEGEADRAIARLLGGGGGVVRTPVAKGRG